MENKEENKKRINIGILQLIQNSNKFIKSVLIQFIDGKHN